MYVCKIHASLPEVEITSLAHIRTNFKRCLSASHDKRIAVENFLFSQISLIVSDNRRNTEQVNLNRKFRIYS
jgi:ABC-type phosphate/phosphonate transport system ATPase subunit